MSENRSGEVRVEAPFQGERSCDVRYRSESAQSSAEASRLVCSAMARRNCRNGPPGASVSPARGFGDAAMNNVAAGAHGPNTTRASATVTVLRPRHVSYQRQGRGAMCTRVGADPDRLPPLKARLSQERRLRRPRRLPSLVPLTWVGRLLHALRGVLGW